MSFPNPRPSVDGDVGGFWPVLPFDHPGFPINHENFDPYLNHEQAPPFKRSRNLESHSSISAPLAPPINPRMNPPILPGSKGTTHIFYKTRMCTKFLQGNCKNGANCTFAHGIEDLREPPPNWQELVREKDGGWDKNCNDDLIHKMKLCKKFYNGEVCPYGENCNFLHERPIASFSSLDEQRKCRTVMPMERESSEISIGTRGFARRNVSDFDQLVNPNMDALRAKQVWKTKLCTKWEITGHCPFRERCHFAHGQSELVMSGAQGDVDDMVNSIPSQTMAVPVPVSSPANLDAGVPVKEVREEKNFFSRWIQKKKINKIYADWLDDLTPTHSFSNEVEDP